MTTYKMTTPTPDGIAIADELETRLGTLNFVDGVPDKETAQKVYDNLDYVRGIDAYLSSIQIASTRDLRKGILGFGPANQTVIGWEQLMDSKSLFLTPNTSSIYFFQWLDVSDGPLVIETPPNVLGIIDDAWFHYVADYGNAGPDKGQGGKYLLIGPGYDDEIPDGYHVLHTKTYGHWNLFRAFTVDGDPGPSVAAAKKEFRVYPLAQKDNPPETNFVNVSGKFMNTVSRGDFGFYEAVNEVVQREPTEGLEKEIRGLLRCIGIEKGKPFNPDARMKKILVEAADVAHATARTMTARPRSDEYYYYPGEGQWTTPFLGGYAFEKDGARLLDARTLFFFFATGVTPAMNQAPIGAGSQYAICYMDSSGTPLDGAKTYKVHLPPNVPCNQFWSFVVYGNQTRCMLQTDQQFPSVSSAKGLVEQNADGSFDVYFGPQAPEGKENNWIQTIPGKGWNMLFRLYGPLEPWFDKSWRPGDPELVA